MKPLIEVKNLQIKLNGKEIIKRGSFSIEKGKTLALLGPSGSGKTTIALAFLELLPKGAVTGDFFFEGKTPNLKRLRGNKIAFVLQQVQNSLNPTRQVGDQLIEGVLFHGLMKSQDALTELLRILDFVGVKDAKGRLKHYPHQFSGGEKQRLLLAQSLLMEPSLLILDEPTSSLDSDTKGQLIQLLQEIQKNFQLTLLIITHEIDLVEALADHVAYLKNGVIEGSQPVLIREKEEKNKVTATCLEKTPLVTLKNIEKRYENKTVLSLPSMTLYENERVGLFGKSGSGKTTLAKLLTTWQKPDRGEILFQGKSLFSFNRKELAQSVQMVFQDPYSALNPHLKIRDSLSEGLNNIFAPSDDGVLEALLASVKLPVSFLNRKPKSLSGGERQRISLVRALSVNPKLLILDEPTSALDEKTTEEILELLKTLQEEKKFTLLFISHDREAINRLCERQISF